MEDDDSLLLLLLDEDDSDFDDDMMRKALRQARTYAVNLPADHPWPPFIIVCDVGRAFELYFGWSGNGRGYDFFPDRQGYRVTIDRLAEAEVQELFRDIWSKPKELRRRTLRSSNEARSWCSPRAA